MGYKFRDLKSSEIDVRVAQLDKEWLTLLLYKDARVDMDILDETVGPENLLVAHFIYILMHGIVQNLVLKD